MVGVHQHHHSGKERTHSVREGRNNNSHATYTAAVPQVLPKQRRLVGRAAVALQCPRRNERVDLALTAECGGRRMERAFLGTSRRLVW